MTTLPRLNLPEAPLHTRQGEDGILRILDPLRRRFVALTPEEWVRQHFVHFLIVYRHYPAGLIGNELSVTLNNTSRRCDTVVYDRNGEPWMIVEYKAPSIPITRKVMDQILRYNIVLKAPYLTVSNGMQTFCCQVDHTTGQHTFLQELPQFV